MPSSVAPFTHRMTLLVHHTCRQLSATATAVRCRQLTTIVATNSPFVHQHQTRRSFTSIDNAHSTASRIGRIVTPAGMNEATLAPAAAKPTAPVWPRVGVVIVVLRRDPNAVDADAVANHHSSTTSDTATDSSAAVVTSSASEVDDEDDAAPPMEDDDTAAAHASAPAHITPTPSNLSQYQVLLVKRKNPPYAGYYALPGGKVEAYETVEQAATRELHEECGLRATIQRPHLIRQIISRPARRAKAMGAASDSGTGTTDRAGRSEDEAHHWILFHVSTVLQDRLAAEQIVAGDDAESAQWVPASDTFRWQELKMVPDVKRSVLLAVTRLQRRMLIKARRDGASNTLASSSQ